MSRAYYNEIDPYAADWLRALIVCDLIAPGDVDTRSIEDVAPGDLHGYTQCHFFAGIGGWSLALRLAGWPDDRPAWTGSCPCQPFSAAGKGLGAADERHLWPAWFYLIAQYRPVVVFGEQVEAAIKHGWLDLVQDDLEGVGYAVGAACLPAAGVGAPHIRSRLWFVADADGGNPGTEREQRSGEYRLLSQNGSARGLADDDEAGCGLERSAELLDGERSTLGDHADRCGALGDMGYPDDEGSQGRRVPSAVGLGHGAGERTLGAAGATFWSGCEWLPCRDGKARPVESGTFPLAHGVPGRVGRLRAYGNAIVPQVAAEMIRAYLEP